MLVKARCILSIEKLHRTDPVSTMLCPPVKIKYRVWSRKYAPAGKGGGLNWVIRRLQVQKGKNEKADQ